MRNQLVLYRPDYYMMKSLVYIWKVCLFKLKQAKAGFKSQIDYLKGHIFQRTKCAKNLENLAILSAENFSLPKLCTSFFQIFLIYQKNNKYLVTTFCQALIYPLQCDNMTLYLAGHLISPYFIYVWTLWGHSTPFLGQFGPKTGVNY